MPLKNDVITTFDEYHSQWAKSPKIVFVKFGTQNTVPMLSKIH